MPLLALLLLSSLGLFAGDTITALGKKWSVRNAADWKASAETLELAVASGPGTPRRPHQFAILEDGPYDAVTIEVDVKRNGKSLLLVYAYQDEAHYNYVHISVDDPAKQPVHNGIFHVFGGERVRISPLEGGPGVLPTNDWTRVKVTWSGKTGEVVCHADGKTSGAMRAFDLSLKHGRIGLGSFNETGLFRNLKITPTYRK
jgi:hypothetical protein